jgi:hypothetical protein
MEGEHKRFNKRLEDVENTNNQALKIAVSVEKLAVNMEHMAEEQKSQGARLARLESAPSDKWNKLTQALITAVASGLVGYFIGAIFK